MTKRPVEEGSSCGGGDVGGKKYDGPGGPHVRGGPADGSPGPAGEGEGLEGRKARDVLGTDHF